MYLRNLPGPAAACPSLNEGDQMFVLDESFFLPLEIPPTNAAAAIAQDNLAVRAEGRRDCLNGDGSVRPPGE